MAIFLPGLEAPGLDRLNGLFVESHAERVHHANIGCPALGSYNDHQRASTLVLRFAGFFGKLWIRNVNSPRWSHSLARTENAATGTAARTGSYARPRPRTNAGSVTVIANASARTRAIGRDDSDGFRVAKIRNGAVHRHLDIRRHNDCGLNRQLRVQILDDRRGGCDLPHRELRQFSCRGL